MTKQALKEFKYAEQNGICAESGKMLPKDLSLCDLHRINPGRNGGKYTPENTLLVLAGIHSEGIHENTSIEDPQIANLKILMDDYRQTIKLRNKIANQLKAAKRHDKLSVVTQKYFLTLLLDLNKKINVMRKEIKTRIDQMDRPIVQAMLSIKGVAEISIAEMITVIDIRKARYPSSIWSLAGWAGSSIDRYKKGIKGGGRMSLRCAFYNLGSSLLRAKNEDYVQFYRTRKEDRTNSNDIVRERCGNGKIKEIPWRDAIPNHRHLDAMRKMMKVYTADCWFVWRTLEGLPTEDLYVKEHLHHENAIINPRSRGWKY